MKHKHATSIHVPLDHTVWSNRPALKRMSRTRPGEIASPSTLEQGETTCWWLPFWTTGLSLRQGSVTESICGNSERFPPFFF